MYSSGFPYKVLQITRSRSSHTTESLHICINCAVRPLTQTVSLSCLCIDRYYLRAFHCGIISHLLVLFLRASCNTLISLRASCGQCGRVGLGATDTTGLAGWLWMIWPCRLGPAHQLCVRHVIRPHRRRF